MNCEICGSIVRGSPINIRVEGSIMAVCGSCSGLGVRVSSPQSSPTIARTDHGPVLPRPVFRRVAVSQTPDLDGGELARDYNERIRLAREKLKITQEELGRRLNEKPSVIRLLESGKLKADNLLARKLERYLKIELLVAGDADEE